MITLKKNSPVSTAHKKKILIVDDHPVYREGLSNYINEEDDLMVCGECDTAEAALTFLEKQQQPDLMIVDLCLKGSHGVDLIKSVHSRFEKVNIFVLSMYEETLYAERVLRAGARGYIMKQEAAESVILAIRKILSGKVYLSEAMTERMLFQQMEGVPEQSSPIQMLSDRELEVFRFIGEGCTTAAIAKNLHLSVKTIETYRANIKTKLNLETNMELIKHAVQWVQNG